MQEAESEGFDLDINKSKKMPQVDRTENICFSDKYFCAPTPTYSHR